MAARPSAHPIRSLRERRTALEAALQVCLADPKPRAVHQLRTATRRVEALLTLVSLLSGMPAHKKAATRTRRELRKIRRAAGSVRDLDVQRDLIRQHASPTMREDARQLRRILRHQRSDAAASLVHLLRHRQSNLTRELESLLDVLEPAESLTLSSTGLATLIRDWFALVTPDPSAQGHDALHNLRKNAKLARYMAETASPNARALAGLARHFESLQQQGGEWHDYHTLTQVARRHVGKTSALTRAFQHQRETALASYRASVLPRKD